MASLLCVKVDTLIVAEMTARGFVRRPERPGHWRSAGGYGHDLEFRHRTLAQWLRPAFVDGGRDGALKMLRGKVDVLIEKQVS